MIQVILYDKAQQVSWLADRQFGPQIRLVEVLRRLDRIAIAFGRKRFVMCDGAQTTNGKRRKDGKRAQFLVNPRRTGQMGHMRVARRASQVPIVTALAISAFVLAFVGTVGSVAAAEDRPGGEAKRGADAPSHLPGRGPMKPPARSPSSGDKHNDREGDESGGFRRAPPGCRFRDNDLGLIA